MPMRTKTRIIGLGNTLLTDDGIGVYTVREVGRRLAQSGRADRADIVEAEVAGFGLMELMAGWNSVILVDSVQFTGVPAGSVVRVEPHDLHTSLRIRSVHEIDLPTVLELGRRLGLEMPRQVTVFAIQVEDVYTFGEHLTAEGLKGLETAADLVLEELNADCSCVVQAGIGSALSSSPTSDVP
jgi:hydrogenase maturation protease